MTWDRPAPVDVWRAVEAYLAVAYEGSPPAPVRERLARLRASPAPAFYECDAFERADGRYALRLGNRFYPHMKLVVEATPAGRALFRVDTHDRHFLDLVTPSDAGLSELIGRNDAIASAVEAAWAAAGILTFREHWRDQVERWRAAHP